MPMKKNSSGRVNRRLRGSKKDERIKRVSAEIRRVYQESKSDKQIMDTDVEVLIGSIHKLLQDLQQGKTGESSDSHCFWRAVKEKFSSIMEKVNNSRSLIVVKEVAAVAICIFNRIKNSNEVLTTACLIVSYILDGIRYVSDNNKECMGLLDQVITLAQRVNCVIIHRPSLKIDRSIKKTIILILEVSISCCTQKKAGMIAKFLKAEVNKEELSNLQRKVDRQFTHISTLMQTLNLNYYTPLPDVDIYPHNAVGIDEPKKKILKLLDWNSKQSLVTVIVHGTGGMGKSTLANAVYSEFSAKKNCKCIRVVVDTNPLPVLQKNMIQELMGADKPLRDFTSPTDAGHLLGDKLQHQEAFIYIDNVSKESDLLAFLPSQAGWEEKVRKLRLLITTRNRSIATALPKKRRSYHKMEYLNPKNAEALVRHVMGREQIDSTVLQKIIQKCAGVPLYLMLRTRLIATADDKVKAYEIVRGESNNCGGTGPRFGGKPVAELIGYSDLPGDLKDAFLDICSYFHRYDWHAVEDIVGIDILDQLEKRDLVTKSGNHVTVHDVLLELGTHMSKETRIKGAREISRSLNAERNKESQPIKGLWFSQDKDSKGIDPIPAKKLEPVSSFVRVLRLKSSAKTIAERDSEITFPKLIYLDAGANPLPFKVCLFKELKYLSYSPRNPEELNLKMPSRLQRLHLNGEFYRGDCRLKLKWPQKLRSLTLCNFKHLQKLPKELSSITYLKFLKITDCDNLVKLPKSLGEMNELRSLAVVNCPKLQNLPNSISKNTSLTCLNLQGCSRLEELPEDFGSLTCLEELNLKGTCLKNLPGNFSQLKGLKKLNLSRCKKLQDLCTNFEGLPRLEYLKLRSCPILKAKWMRVIVKMKKKTIKDVDITGSEMLLQEWGIIGSPNLQLKKGNV